MNESESNNENDDDNNNNNNNNNNYNNNENENENYDDYKIKQINDYFKMIDESISFEEQLNLLKVTDDIIRYWCMSYYYDDKELNLKIFKLKYAFLANELDEKLFEEISGHTFVTLANKVLNTTNKEENRKIVEDIKKNMDEFYEHDGFHNYIIQSITKRVDLVDAAKIILEFNKTIQLPGN